MLITSCCLCQMALSCLDCRRKQGASVQVLRPGVVPTQQGCKVEVVNRAAMQESLYVCLAHHRHAVQLHGASTIKRAICFLSALVDKAD